MMMCNHGKTIIPCLLLLVMRTVNGFVLPRQQPRVSSLLHSTSDKEKRKVAPDYGKTSIEVDKIQVAKVQQKWKRQDLFGSSLVEETLQEMKNDKEFQRVQREIMNLGQDGMSKQERNQRRKALKELGISSFPDLQLTRTGPKILQMNIGLYCNQACQHCHVESSPLRKQDVMTEKVAAQCLRLLSQTPSITTLDITGGAPELCPVFRYLVATAKSIRPDLEIIDRCNLTVLQEPGQGQDLINFLKKHNVRIIASLPCYSANNVDQQRGNGVFDRSIAALIALNENGYGKDDDDDNEKKEDSYYSLDLVYNPLGAFLPPPQEKLQEQYKKQLKENFGITFNQLFTITNMPIKRFADYLVRRDELKDYMDLLYRNYNPSTVDTLMCRDTVSIGYDGKIYDCDFNQQLGYVLGRDLDNLMDNGEDNTTTTKLNENGLNVFDLESFYDLQKYKIRLDNHCFGCTAGMGSS